MRGSILELTTISQDFRFEVVGGVLGALDIWNIAIVPSLLTCSPAPQLQFVDRDQRGLGQAL